LSNLSLAMLVATELHTEKGMWIMDRVAKDSDELMRLMEEDELQDQAEVQSRMAIGNYAKLRHVTPQSVHYYIRNKRLNKYKCDCGRFVIDVAEADIAMGFKKKEVPDGGTEEQAGDGAD